jgi:hypothetical protein
MCLNPISLLQGVKDSFTFILLCLSLGLQDLCQYRISKVHYVLSSSHTLLWQLIHVSGHKLNCHQV